MELPPLSIEQLSSLVASHVPPSQLFEILSQYEPQACLISVGGSGAKADDVDSQLLSLFYTSFFFAHILTRQIPEARALTQRIPEALRINDTAVQNCITLLRALWQVQPAQVYQSLRRLPWPGALQPLVRRFDGFFQDSTLIAVSTSFEAIRPSDAANFLGLDIDAAEKGDPGVLQKFTDCGWTWSPETQLLYPSPITVPSSANTQSSNGIRDAMAMLGSRAG